MDRHRSGLCGDGSNQDEREAGSATSWNLFYSNNKVKLDYFFDMHRNIEGNLDTALDSVIQNSPLLKSFNLISGPVLRENMTKKLEVCMLLLDIKSKIHLSVIVEEYDRINFITRDLLRQFFDKERDSHSSITFDILVIDEAGRCVKLPEQIDILCTSAETLFNEITLFRENVIMRD
jgi:hypothetical protein